MNKDSESDMIAIREAALLTGLKVSRLYNEVFYKRIPHIKIGSSLRFSKMDLIKWLESQKRGVYGK